MGALLFQFDAGHHVPSILHGETAPSRFGNPQWLQFTPYTGTVTTYFQRAMCPAINTSGVRITMDWTAAATAGTAVWGFSFAPYPPGTPITLPPGSVFLPEHLGVATKTGPSLANQYVTVTIPFADVQAQGTHFFRLRVRHLGADPLRTITVAPVFLSLVGENVT